LDEIGDLSFVDAVAKRERDDAPSKEDVAEFVGIELEHRRRQELFELLHLADAADDGKDDLLADVAARERELAAVLEDLVRARRETRERRCRLRVIPLVVAGAEDGGCERDEELGESSSRIVERRELRRIEELTPAGQPRGPVERLDERTQFGAKL